MLDLLTGVLSRAPARCSYADARHVATDEQDLLVRNGRVDSVGSASADGVGVRVRTGGGWGFAATREATRAGIEDALARALAIAESQPAVPAGPLAAVEPAHGHWACAYELDPFDVSLEDKLELLFAAESALRGDPRIVRSDAMCASRRVRTAFASTEGAACTQERVECGGAISVIAVDGDELQVRSYPAAAHGGSAACAGWEHVLGFDLAGHAPRIADRGGGDRAAQRAGLPGRPSHRDPRRRAARAADPRVDRARARARPDAAHGGLLRRDELGQPR